MAIKEKFWRGETLEVTQFEKRLGNNTKKRGKGKHTGELDRQDWITNQAMVLISCYYSTAFEKE